MKAMRWVMAIVVTAVAASVWVWAAQQHVASPRGLAANLPPGALLTIESPDFSKLLADWNSSQEQAAWMRSASFNVFTNSRLYGRLTDAEQEFAGAAGTDFGSPFLKSVAGTQSIFAWYNIGNLELLYITHLKPGQSDGIALLASRARFTARKAGDTTFYVRSGGVAGDDSGTSSQQRTVAFAQRGEWFVFATREDLLANALLLMQGTAKSPSLAEQGWYEAAAKAAPAQPGDLRMLLDLDRITRTPQFETYWVQRNVTDTRRYRAAAIDLYREPGQFREERVLLPAQAAAISSDSEDTSALTELVPPDAGVFRATAAPSAANAIAELRDKVLERAPMATTQEGYAPSPDLGVGAAGDTTDLETRIDTPQPVKEPADAWLNPLQRVLKDAPLTAMLSVSSSSARPASLFLSIHSAVVLRRSGVWDEDALSRAVLEALRGRLTVSGVGIAWTKQTVEGVTLMTATGANAIALAVRGNTAVIGADEALVRGIVTRMGNSTEHHAAATVIAEFRPPQARPAFLQLTSTLDHAGGAQSESPHSAAAGGNDPQADAAQDSGSASPQSEAPAQQDASPTQPTFLRETVGSLSQSFSSLGAERFLERRDGDRVHQTILYLWAPPKPALSPSH